MVTVTTSLSRKTQPHSRRFPFDALGATALLWSGGFLILAFCLGAWLR